jgi:hypothetical protein
MAEEAIVLECHLMAILLGNTNYGKLFLSTVDQLLALPPILEHSLMELLAMMVSTRYNSSTQRHMF